MKLTFSTHCQLAVGNGTGARPYTPYTSLATTAETVVRVAGQNAATLSVPATAATYESVLVTLVNVNLLRWASTRTALSRLALKMAPP